MKKLFYSYSHEDESFLKSIKKHLSALRQENLIDGWCDRKISAGSKFDNEIKAAMQSSDIILLLLSSNFLASQSCREEMKEALRLSEEGIKVIPVILTPCAWKDFQGISELMALPLDGKPVTDWSDQETAFVNIYEGIRLVVEEIGFSAKAEFESKLTRIEFISQEKDDLRLDDIFVFPNIVHLTEHDYDVPVADFNKLWGLGNHMILQGEETSGKTTVCKKMFLECLSKNLPVLMISGQEIKSPRNHDSLLEKSFNEQFNGNYASWQKQKNKTLIIDDLVNSSRLEFLDYAKEHFDRIFITTSEDDYLSYFRNEKKLASYGILSIKYFSHSQQELLIKCWKGLRDTETKSEQINHGEIDLIEDRLNSIIHNNKIVPRYPFYILSILQTYEGFMPQNMRITAYGHCYQALITAQLLKCGIQKEDIDSTFNFLTHFSFDFFVCKEKENYSENAFSRFVLEYRNRFVISEAVINRLKKGGVIVIDQQGTYQFSYSFVYYFFLGNFFARNYQQYRNVLEEMVEKSYLRDNRYVLIFTIHHAHDDDLIETILLHTMTAMERRSIAKLTKEETKTLSSALTEIPRKIISRRSTEKERKSERERRDNVELEERETQEEHEIEDLHSLYKSFKNIDILGQILKNKYGSFSKDMLGEIIVTIADAGLRIVTLITDETSMRELEDYLLRWSRETGSRQKKLMEKEDYVRRLVRAYCFFLVAGVLGKIVASIKKPELSEVITQVCMKENTPAYDLIDFFFVLGTITKLQRNHVNKMSKLLREFDQDRNEIAKRLLSIVMQDYLNKHNVQYELRQKIFKELKIDYRPNLQPRPRKRK